eukprot:jgi/Mesvir1/21798/Mv04190-RA.1
MEGRVASDPLKEIVGEGKNGKYVTECKCMYLSGKGIQKIRNFERLVNLEELWLNNNQLTHINNLDGNFRLRRLYVQDNNISTLAGSLEHFKFLEVLDLSNNALRDLGKVLHHLSSLPFLTELELKGNACCEEPDYRATVIHHLPTLKVFDSHAVTPAERLAANELFGMRQGASRVAFGETVPRSTVTPTSSGKKETMTATEKRLVEEVRSIERKRQEAARVVAAQEQEVEMKRTQRDLGRTLSPPLPDGYWAKSQDAPPQPGGGGTPAGGPAGPSSPARVPKDVLKVFRFDREASEGVDAAAVVAAAANGGANTIKIDQATLQQSLEKKQGKAKVVAEPVIRKL